MYDFEYRLKYLIREYEKESERLSGRQSFIDEAINDLQVTLDEYYEEKENDDILGAS